MALDYNILDKKPNITFNSNFNETSTVTCKDLLADTYDPQFFSDMRFIIVNKHYVARPDLISFAVYHTDAYADLICKINGISNPFEINENDVIILPHVEDISKAYVKTATKSELNTDGKNTLNINNTLRKDVNDVRSPGRQTVNDYNYIIDKTTNLVFY